VTSLVAVPATGEVPALPAAGTPADGPVVPGRIAVPAIGEATSALAATLHGHPADADLALVACGGEYDEAAGASEDDTVVFARSSERQP
jgi:hypothetical protein